jgi:serine/threonine protein kinase
MINKELNSRYVITKLIADGGMSEVYHARDKILNREVAIKKLKVAMYTNPAKIKKEVEFMLSLNHPNIVKIFDFFDESGDVYIVMEYVEGKTLKEIVNFSGKLNVNNAILYVQQICSALNYAHVQNIIHRDIKPQNIMVDNNGQVKIIDFGIAKSKLSEETATKSFFGSLYFVSPEQISGQKISEKTDIYSTGILLFYLLSGKFPFTGEKEYDVALKHIEKPISRITEIVSDVPQSVENIIIKATYKNPNNRYETIGLMEQDLDSALAFDRENEEAATLEEKKSPSPNENKKSDKDPKNKKRKIIIASLLATLILLGTIALITNASKSNKTYKMPELNTSYSKTQINQLFQQSGVTLSDSNYEYNYSDIVVKDNYLKANKSSGEEFKNVDELKITLSNGPENELINVENYIGRDYYAVKTELERKGLIVSVLEVTSGSSTANTIVKQDPQPGSSAQKGDKITLTVKVNAKIRVEEEKCEQKVLVDKKYQGYNIKIQYKENTSANNEFREDTIYGIHPESQIKSGEEIASGETRILIYSVGKKPNNVEPTQNQESAPKDACPIG